MPPALALYRLDLCSRSPFSTALPCLAENVPCLGCQDTDYFYTPAPPDSQVLTPPSLQQAVGNLKTQNAKKI